jgi:hypothetical protein
MVRYTKSGTASPAAPEYSPKVLCHVLATEKVS